MLQIPTMEKLILDGIDNCDVQQNEHVHDVDWLSNAEKDKNMKQIGDPPEMRGLSAGK